MGHRKHLGSLSACLAAAGLALTMGVGTARADGVSQGAPGNCVWTQGAGGCSFPARVTGLTEVFVAWTQGTTAPTVDGNSTPLFCGVPPSTEGVCAYLVNAVADSPVTVVADPSSSGAASEQDTI
jgi:hypothetical protein